MIRERILTGEFKPGVALNQSELADAFGMSRIPIRDALQLLAAEGMVSLKAHSSATVAPLRLMDLQELYEIRMAMEPRLSSVAVPLLTSEDLAEIEEAYADLSEHTDSADWLRRNDRFHSALYGCSRRPRSIEIVDRARQSTARYIGISKVRQAEAIEMEHRLIYEAVLAGQAARVESLVAAHLSSGFEVTMRYVADAERAGGTEVAWIRSIVEADPED